MSYYPEGMSEQELQDLYMTRMENWMKTVLGRYKSMQLCIGVGWAVLGENVFRMHPCFGFVWARW